MTAKLLNEAKGIKELGFKSISGIINDEGVFEFDEDANEFFIVDADNNLVDGIQDNVGLIDVLNKKTVYDNLTTTQQGNIKPYVTKRMANFSSKINAIENFVEEDNENLVPIYKEINGWEMNLMDLKKIEDAPKEVHDYISYLEDELKVPIKILSVGPDRKQTFFR